ncbi:hypothetical protein [uncultured Friedmanniella sp.]|uniref:hypothetical protein n=1 Tax=uncultured Friedmanniella sp. TaxID=335381 RepID=UPI0035CA7078
MSELLSASELPDDFVYPAEFLRVVQLNLVDLEPWLILQGESLLDRHRGLQARYPTRRLVPFAHRTDRDDIACWDLDLGLAQVSVVDDFEVLGYEQGEVYLTFYGWFRSAVDDLIEFDDQL